MVGYPATSVDYQVWDPVRGKVFDVGVPFLDENVEPGWWKVPSGGSGVIEEEDEVQFPDLDVDSSPQLQQMVEMQGVVGGGVEPEMPELVEDSSDDDGEDDD